MTNIPKTVITVDSQKLTAYQSCAKKFHYSFVENIELASARKGSGIAKGGFVHHMFETFNNQRMQGNSLRDCMDHVITLVSNIEDSEFQIDLELRLDLLARFLEYLKHYKKEIEGPRYRLVAVEKGFTKKLYEDSSNIFIYEGRIDAVIHDTEEDKYFWRDYKTKSGGYRLYEQTNQFIGYSWAVGGAGQIDYISTGKKLTKDTFSREEIKIYPAQIERWISRTVYWLKRMNEDVEFIENPASCQGMYGNCQYRHLCERTPEVRSFLVGSKYHKKEPWSAW